MAATCGDHGHRSKQTGEPCGRKVPLGAIACRYHGGASPQAKRKAEERRELLTIKTAVRTYGRPVNVDPAEALLDEVRWTAGHVAWLRDQVQQLESQTLVWGVADETDKGATEFPGTDTTSKAMPSVWLDLYRQERKHLVDVCKVALAAGVEERRVQLAEQAGAQLAQVIRAVLADLGVADDPRVPAALQRAIGTLTGP